MTSSPPVTPPSPASPADEYLTLAEAAALLGVRRQRLWEITRRANLTVYQRPSNLVARLLRRADVEQLALPQPLPRPRPTT